MIVTTTMLLMIVTFFVVIAGKRILLSINLMSAYFYFTIIFSVIGVYLYAYTDLFLYQYQYLKFDFLASKDFAHALLIAHGGLLLVFLGYLIPARMSPGFIRSPGLFLPPAQMTTSPRRFGVRLMIGLIGLLTLAYLVKHRDTLLSGGMGAILTSLTSHVEQIELRYDVGGDFFFLVFTTCVLTYMTIYLAVLRTHATGPLKHAWILFLIVAVYFHLGIFQKRPLILFLITLVYAFSATKKGADFSAAKMIRMTIVAALTGLLVLFTLYSLIFSGTGAGFSAGQVMFISVMKVVVRLANSVLMTAHIYPQYEPYFGLSNVRALTVLFDTQYYMKDALMFDIFSTSDINGSTASSALVDFYGGFGWGGLLFLAPLLGFFLYLLEAYIRAQPHTIDRFVFSIFSIWFVYYLTQANFFRAAHGYGFFYFVVIRYVLLLSLPPTRADAQDPPETPVKTVEFAR